MNTTTRRSFVKGGALAAASLATAMSSKRVHGASERIRVGFIGVGGRAGSLLRGFQANEDVQLVALCDVYKKTLDNIAGLTVRSKVTMAGVTIGKVTAIDLDRSWPDGTRWRFAGGRRSTARASRLVVTSRWWGRACCRRACATTPRTIRSRPTHGCCSEARKRFAAIVLALTPATAAWCRRSNCAFPSARRSLWAVSA